MTKRKLVLEDGTEFIGEAFGGDDSHSGELIFYTGMTGYQEMITDPCYFGKMVVMTYPSIGAYGINRDDFEAIAPSIEGLIVKEICELPVNFRSEETLDAFMKRHHIPGISGIDTRMLTKIIRDKGVMKGTMIDVDKTAPDVDKKRTMNDIMKCVSIDKPYTIPGRKKRIVVVDLGVKQSILHELTERDCHITVVPYHFTQEQITALKPDGILISNGPGNPEEMTDMIKVIDSLIGSYPIFGVGLGHQLIALAYGATVTKLKVGQYGINFPVKDLQHDKTWITTVSHDYIVEESALPREMTITHRLLNDGKIAGIDVSKDKVFGVQFHPEGAPGSNETRELFGLFVERIAKAQNNDGGCTHA